MLSVVSKIRINRSTLELFCEGLAVSITDFCYLLLFWDFSLSVSSSEFS